MLDGLGCPLACFPGLSNWVQCVPLPHYGSTLRQILQWQCMFVPGVQGGCIRSTGDLLLLVAVGLARHSELQLGDFPQSFLHSVKELFTWLQSGQG